MTKKEKIVEKSSDGESLKTDEAVTLLTQNAVSDNQNRLRYINPSLSMKKEIFVTSSHGKSLKTDEANFTNHSATSNVPLQKAAFHDSYRGLPYDMMLEILARVPKSSVARLSLVSRKFCQIFRSREMLDMRRRLGNDAVFIMFVDTNKAHLPRLWYSFSRSQSNPMVSLFQPTHVPTPQPPTRAIFSFGPMVYLVCGSTSEPASLWIYNSFSSEFRKGPHIPFNLTYKSAGLVGNTLYIIGVGRNGPPQLQAVSFNIGTNLWRASPLIQPPTIHEWRCAESACIDTHIYSLSSNTERPVHYNTRNGMCGYFDLLGDDWWKTGVTVIDNTLFVYYESTGLTWFNPVLNTWTLVSGLSFSPTQSVAMSEFNGQLAFFWTEVDGHTCKFFCKLVTLERIDQGFTGHAEPSHLLRIFPQGFGFGLRWCFTITG